jgi:3-oxoacyl-[acyl-carrier-protein] synthase II
MGALGPGIADAAGLLAAYRTGAPAEPGLHLRRITEDPIHEVPAPKRRRMDRLGLLATAVSKTALADAEFVIDERSGPRTGVVLGTGHGPLESLERFSSPLLQDGPAAANPAVFPNTVYNAAAGQVGMVLGTTGPTSTVTSMHAAGATALALAHDLLRSGAADALVVPAVDTFSPAMEAVYRGLPLFHSGRRHGYTLTEGGYALVLERRSAAEARGATILGELVGYGTAHDALGIGRWDLSGHGLEAAMRVALDTTGLRLDHVAEVWANAAGLVGVDRPERSAIQRLFADRTEPVPVREPKRLLGEPCGAGGQLAAVLALTLAAETGSTEPVLINSSSLGGAHVSFVLRPMSP